MFTHEYILASCVSESQRCATVRLITIIMWLIAIAQSYTVWPATCSCLQITQPTLPWDWERLVNIQPNTRLVLSNAEGTEVLKGGLHVTHEMQRSGEVLHEGQQVLLFLGSPALSSFNDFKVCHWSLANADCIQVTG